MTVLLASWVLVLLAVFGLSFNYEARTDLRLSALEGEVRASRSLALSGVAVAEELLLRTGGNEWDAPAEGWDRNPRLREVRLGTGSFSVGYSAGPDPGKGSAHGCEDEGRRIPVGAVTRAILGRLPGLSPEAVEVVLALKEASGPRSSLTLDALSGLDGESLSAVRRYVTVYATEGVNINTAPPTVLEAMGIPKKAVRRIVAHRNGPDELPGTPDDSPFTSVVLPAGGLGDCSLAPREAAAISFLGRTGLLGVTSNVFRVRSRGWLPGRRSFYEVEEVLERSSEGELSPLEWRESWRS